MSGKLRLNGATSGYSELQAPDVAGDQVFTFPDTGGEVATKTGGGPAAVGYQQGTWTPTVSFGSINTVDAYWSRVGNQVTIQGNLRGFTNTTQESDVTVSGIPYERTAAMFAIGTARTGHLNFGEGKNIHSCLLVGNTVKIGVSAPTIDGTAAPAARYIQYTSFITSKASNTQFAFSLTYFTDDTTWTPQNGATVS